MLPPREFSRRKRLGSIEFAANERYNVTVANSMKVSREKTFINDLPVAKLPTKATMYTCIFFGGC